MAVDEKRRKRLHDALERTLGSDEAATMMEMVPSREWDEIATKSEIDQKMDSMANQLRAEIEGLRAEMHALARRLIQWTSSMVVASAGLAFAAGRLL